MTNTRIVPHTLRYQEDGHDFPVTVKEFNLSKERDRFRSRYSWNGYKKVVEEIISEMKSFKPRSWKNGEIQIVDIAAVEIDPFYSVVYFRVKCPPVQGNQETDDKIYKVLRLPPGTERIGSIVLAVTTAGKLILTQQYKPAAQEWMLEFPRGVADRNTEPNGVESASKVLTHEIGANISPANQGEQLGEIRPDSGLYFGKATVVLFRDVEYNTNQIRARRDKTHSEIFVEEYLPAEVMNLIASGQITCGITIAAFMLAIAKGVIKL